MSHKNQEQLTDGFKSALKPVIDFEGEAKI